MSAHSAATLRARPTVSGTSKNWNSTHGKHQGHWAPVRSGAGATTARVGRASRPCARRASRGPARSTHGLERRRPPSSDPRVRWGATLTARLCTDAGCHQTVLRDRIVGRHRAIRTRAWLAGLGRSRRRGPLRGGRHVGPARRAGVRDRRTGRRRCSCPTSARDARQQGRRVAARALRRGVSRDGSGRPAPRSRRRLRRWSKAATTSCTSPRRRASAPRYRTSTSPGTCSTFTSPTCSARASSRAETPCTDRAASERPTSSSPRSSCAPT